MVKKLGQRRFLLKSGYTEEELDRMSPSTAHSLISDMEKTNRKRREKEARMSQLKDSNEILEEMAKVMAVNWFNETIIDTAKRLYNAGYRKIPEGSVVLTKEEFDEDYVTKQDRDYWKNKTKILGNKLKQARKETAKEFAGIVYKALTDQQIWTAKQNWWLQNGECFELKDLLKQILKQQFGVVEE